MFLNLLLLEEIARQVATDELSHVLAAFFCRTEDEAAVLRSDFTDEESQAVGIDFSLGS